jgi:hypothetical protein
MPEEQKPKSKVGDWIFLAVILGLVLSIVLSVLRLKGGHSERASTGVQATTFLLGLHQYRVEYGAYPAGGNPQLLMALAGANPRGIVFFQAKPENINSKGEFIDRWGTPFQIDLSNPKVLRIWSCGKDRIDHGGAKGSDDLPIELPVKPMSP